MIYILIILIGVPLYFGLPFIVQLILTIINSAYPDPIPIIDEIVMYAGLLSKMSNAGRILTFVSDHPILGILIGAVAIYLLVGGVNLLLS